MTEKTNSKQYDLEDRTLEFAKHVRDFARKVHKDISNFEDLKNAKVTFGKIAKSKMENIGFFSKIEKTSNCRVAPKIIADLKVWIDKKGFDAVVWNDRGSNFKQMTEMDFNEDNVVDFVTDLGKNARLLAEKHVISTPDQIETPIRQRLRIEFGQRNLSQYRTGFWLDKNTFIVSYGVGIKNFLRKAPGDALGRSEKVPMLIMKNVTQMVVDNNNKILGEDRYKRLGLWLEDVKKLYKEQELWHKSGQ